MSLSLLRYDIKALLLNIVKEGCNYLLWSLYVMMPLILVGPIQNIIIRYEASLLATNKLDSQNTI